MERVLAAVGRLLRGEDGQDLLEYGLLAALIACFAIGVINTFSQVVTNTFWNQVVNLAQSL